MLNALQIFNKCKTHGRLVIISLKNPEGCSSGFSVAEIAGGCVLTFVVSTPPYLALTLGSWMVSRCVPVTLRGVLPLQRRDRSCCSSALQISHSLHDACMYMYSKCLSVCAVSSHLMMLQLGSMLRILGSSV